MARVLKIELKGKKGNKANVFLEGETEPIFASFFAIEKLRVREGADLDLSAKRELIKESAIIEGFDRAVKYVVSRPRSEREIRLYLAKGSSFLKLDNEMIVDSDSFLSSDIELSDVENTILDKLKEYRYVDDRAFANSYIGHYKHLRGQKLLRYELGRLGVDKDIIDEAFLEFEGQFDEAFNLAEKWARGKKVVDYYKLNSFLYSKGFDTDEIKSAVEKLKESLEGEHDEDCFA